MSIEAIVQLLESWRARSSAGSSRELDELFATLVAATPEAAFEIEDRIWEAWTRHADPVVSASMDKAIAAIACKDYRSAQSILDRLIDEYPGWAEAWHKRATLFLLEGRHTESLRDIFRTLSIEARHFGAMMGFAQLCIRLNSFDAARLSLRTVLGINPHCASARAILETLPGEQPTVH